MKTLLHFESVRSTANAREEIEAVTAIWPVPFDLPYLDGHFPGQPIVPAVAIVDISVELLRREAFKSGYHLKGIKTSKFMNPLMPSAEIEVMVDIDCRRVSENEWSVDWKLRSEEATASPHLIARLSLLF
ncbi:MAG: hypothetical protein V4692_08750 [Bdellovibrionota bacterium]